ncbi:MAG: Slp family lipoprotein, partial [bacterium]
MKLKINNKFFTLIRGQIIILPLLFFCASCAPFSKELMRQVDESITYQDVKKDISAYIGKQVLWGGVIIETKNRPEETIIVVRQTELD